MSAVVPIRKVTVVGVGAIGGVFAGWLGSGLAAGRIELSAVARGDTLRALQSQGLTWTDAEGNTRCVKVHASDDPATLGPQDLVIVAVKAPAMARAAALVRALLAPHTVVLVAMNGVPWWFFDGLPGVCSGLQLQTVDPGGLIAATLPTRHVLGCVVHVSAASPRPAH